MAEGERPSMRGGNHILLFVHCITLRHRQAEAHSLIQCNCLYPMVAAPEADVYYMVTIEVCQTTTGQRDEKYLSFY